MLLARQFDRPLERRPTDLAALVKQTAQDVRPFIEQRRQELSLDLAPDLGTLAVEPDKMRDSLDNLLLNAIKFTPDGGKIQVGANGKTDGAGETRVADSG